MWEIKSVFSKSVDLIGCPSSSACCIKLHIPRPATFQITKRRFFAVSFAHLCFFGFYFSLLDTKRLVMSLVTVREKNTWRKLVISEWGIGCLYDCLNVKSRASSVKLVWSPQISPSAVLRTCLYHIERSVFERNRTKSNSQNCACGQNRKFNLKFDLVQSSNKWNAVQKLSNNIKRLAFQLHT